MRTMKLYPSCISRYTPKRGMLWEFVGRFTITTFRNTRNERKTVILKDIFSPESAGIANVKMFRTARKMIGRIIFKKIYSGFLFR
jgi:hypothetical protein